MIIDTKQLNDVRVTNNSVIGEAAKDTRLLKEGELVVMVEGVRAFINLVQKEFPHARQAEESTDLGGHGDFHTFKTWEDTIDIFLNKPGQLVKYDPTEMKPTDFMEQGLDLEHDVTGDFIDMGRHMEGIPESFGSLHNGQTRNRRVRIYVDNGNRAGMSERVIAHRSERVIRLIDALEQANVRCELAVIESSGCSHSECIVKRFNESLNLEDVAIATHPEFLRRICFRVTEWSKQYESGYGSSLWLENRVDAFKSNLNDELTIFVHTNIDHNVDGVFDQLEEKIVKELSEVIPTVGLMQVSVEGVKTGGLGE